MPMWKRNLIVCWFGMFVTGVGMSQIAPILPLYIKQLGVDNPGSIAQFSGIAFGITFIVSAIFSPIWGLAADKYGRKPMLLRASLGMAIVIGCMGFAANVYVLIGLRLLQGVITGYSTACTTLIATQTDKEHAGWALGTLSTANIAGSLLGPTVGGYIAEKFGYQTSFDSLTGRVFGFSMAAGYLGVFGGSVLGGQVAAWFGVRHVFYVTSALLLINAVWVYFTVFKRLNINKAG